MILEKISSPDTPYNLTPTQLDKSSMDFLRKRGRCGHKLFILKHAFVMTFLALALPAGPLAAEEAFEREPINYLTAAPGDRVAQLQARISAGQVHLKYDARHGYLPSVLEELRIPVSSQLLVFSKTSFQQKRISPRAPRAVYFNDEIYLGHVDDGEILEVSAVDPHLGAVFYSLKQNEVARPQFMRHTHDCLQCHSSSLTEGVPGHLVRSVYPDDEGFPILSAGSFAIDQTSPLRQRWGGWYVTGTTGGQPHMGNQIASASVDPDRFAEAADVESLKGRFDVSRYLTGHSDVVALMILEHQSKMHNLITKANHQARLAQRDEDIISGMLERKANYDSDSTTSRLKAAAEPLVHYMLFCGETPLTAPLRGASGFAEEFGKRGPRDQQGRSLRDLDLTRRMFKYPCSYLVYSEAFDALPPSVRKHVDRRLWEVLSGQDQSQDFSHLSATDRRAILEILLETKKDWPAYWKLPPNRT